MSAPGEIAERLEAFAEDLRAAGMTVAIDWSADGYRADVVVRVPPRPGPVDLVLALQPGLKLMCCGCPWTAAASSYAQLSELSAGHDDAPAQRHIVRLAAGGSFPTDQLEFEALLEAQGAADR